MGRLITALPCSRTLNHIKLDLCCSCYPYYFRSLFAHAVDALLIILSSIFAALAIRATSVPCLLML